MPEISIHVPRVEDDVNNSVSVILLGISIHVPRVEDDKKDAEYWHKLVHFNPRPPCGGRR